MSNFSDRDGHRPPGDGPWWPLDLIRSIGRRAKYFENALALPRLLAADAEAMGAPLSEAEVCARGWALIEALLPTDFVGAVGAGPEACDIYAVDYAVDCATDHATDHATGAPGPSAARPAQRLQLSLMLYRFAGQPPILMISIAPRPAEPERS